MISDSPGGVEDYVPRGICGRALLRTAPSRGCISACADRSPITAHCPEPSTGGDIYTGINNFGGDLMPCLRVVRSFYGRECANTRSPKGRKCTRAEGFLVGKV